jgi:hypothetical protein
MDVWPIFCGSSVPALFFVFIESSIGKDYLFNRYAVIFRRGCVMKSEGG